MGFVAGRIFSRRWLLEPAIASLEEFPFGVWLYVFLSFPWTLADLHKYDGQEGVELAIKILRQELMITMALAG